MSSDALYRVLCQYILASIRNAWEPSRNLGISNSFPIKFFLMRTPLNPSQRLPFFPVALFPFYFLNFLFFALTLCPFVLQGADVTDPGTETEESLGASDSTQRPADSQTPCRKIQESPSNQLRARRAHLTLSTCAHESSRHPATYQTLPPVTEECVMCCCLFDGKSSHVCKNT